MPHLFYSSYENRTDDDAVSLWADDNNRAAILDRLDKPDFATFCRRWYTMKKACANKVQNAVVSVSRLWMEVFSGKADNIHVP